MLKPIRYYFKTNKNDTALTAIVSDSRFNDLVNYFLTHQSKEIILRNIKADFPDLENLEAFIDKLVSNQLLIRKNKRYSLAFPIYTEEHSVVIPETIYNAFQSITEQKHPNNYFIFGEWLWSVLFSEQREEYFFGVSNQLELITRHEVGTDQLKMVSIASDTSQPFNLVSYFDLHASRKKLPAEFDHLQHLIGDVDIHYFMPQIRKVLRTIGRNKQKKPTKRNIFQEALCLTGDIKMNEDGSFTLISPVLKHETTIPKNEVLDWLQENLEALWITIENINERVFFKKQIYSVFFTYMFKQEKQICYFKL